MKFMPKSGISFSFCPKMATLWLLLSQLSLNRCPLRRVKLWWGVKRQHHRTKVRRKTWFLSWRLGRYWCNWDGKRRSLFVVVWNWDRVDCPTCATISSWGTNGSCFVPIWPPASRCSSFARFHLEVVWVAISPTRSLESSLLRAASQRER